MAWMSEEAAATVLGVTFRTIRRRVGNGSLRAMRQGRQIFVDIEIARIPSPNQQNSETSVALASPPPLAAAKPVAPQVTAPALINESHVAHLPASRRMPINPLSASTLGIATLPSPLPPLPAGAVPVSLRELQSRSWMGIAIWLLLTLFLSASVAAGWIYHLGTLRLHEVEGGRQQAVLSAQQAQADHERQIAAQTTTANARENTLAGELSAIKTKLDETNRKLSDQQKTAATLSAELKESSTHLARAQSERQALSQKLVSTQASAQLLRWQVTLSDAVHQLATRLPQPTPQTNTTAEIPPQDAQPSPTENIYAARTGASDRDSASADSDDAVGRRRLLPYQPPTLGQEDARVALRPIVAPDRQDEAGDPTRGQPDARRARLPGHADAAGPDLRR